MSRPDKSYLVNNPIPYDEAKIHELPHIVYWITRKNKQVLMEQEFHIDDNVKNLSQHFTKLRKIIRKRKGFVRFHSINPPTKGDNYPLFTFYKTL